MGESHNLPQARIGPPPPGGCSGGVLEAGGMKRGPSAHVRGLCGGVSLQVGCLASPACAHHMAGCEIGWDT